MDSDPATRFAPSIAHDHQNEDSSWGTSGDLPTRWTLPEDIFGSCPEGLPAAPTEAR